MGSDKECIKLVFCVGTLIKPILDHCSEGYWLDKDLNPEPLTPYAKMVPQDQGSATFSTKRAIWTCFAQEIRKERSGSHQPPLIFFI